jgi:hypothetical protein
VPCSFFFGTLASHGDLAVDYNREESYATSAGVESGLMQFNLCWRLVGGPHRVYDNWSTTTHLSTEQLYYEYSRFTKDELDYQSHRTSLQGIILTSKGQY